MRPTNDSSLARAQREISFHVTLLSFFFFFFFFAVSGDYVFFRFDKFTYRLYLKKKSQVYLLRKGSLCALYFRLNLK